MDGENSSGIERVTGEGLIRIQRRETALRSIVWIPAGTVLCILEKFAFSL